MDVEKREEIEKKKNEEDVEAVYSSIEKSRVQSTM